MSGHTEQVKEVQSPSGRLLLRVGFSADAGYWYELSRGENIVVSRSSLGLQSPDGNQLLPLDADATVVERSFDETWEQPWGEQRFVRNNYAELCIEASSGALRFRLYDDGLGFRYELSGVGLVTVQQEATEFNVARSANAWWIPALGHNHYEHLYQKTSLQEIGTAHTPLVIEAGEKTYISIHEAALYDYGAMNIVPTDKGLVSSITPLKTGEAAQVTLPFNTPWRTIVVADTPYELTSSRIMLNLNEPSKIEDTSWIQPSKFMGIWWGMFIEQFTWASGERHGATTANAFRYINACKKLGIPALLIEGWNEGWDGDWTQNGDKMNHMKPYADFDIAAITSYAKSQGVDIVGHHETSGNVAHYEYELPEAYDYYRHFGVRYIKTGYVSPRMNGDEFHSSQMGVKHYQKTVEMAAERGIMLDIHEPVKGTGIERTWPNLMTREGVMGQEYEGGAITAEHAAVLPFTRLLAGPLDYTPGLVSLKGTVRKVRSTVARQLAFYVTMYSPLQMAADLPEHYEQSAAVAFIRDVPTSWEVTTPIDGVIGDYYVVARKDRHSDDWYLGGVTDEASRTLSIALDFLSEHRSYTMTLYRDAADADCETNPEAYDIEERVVTCEDTLDIFLAPGGGFAARFAPVENSDPSPYPTHQ